ncbi:MAG: hypothetical protein QM228_05165 [Atribacterota bacterium]|nr:hypothetical protein [Atribacterota bacterium]
MRKYKINFNLLLAASVLAWCTVPAWCSLREEKKFTRSFEEE